MEAGIVIVALAVGVSFAWEKYVDPWLDKRPRRGSFIRPHE